MSTLDLAEESDSSTLKRSRQATSRRWVFVCGVDATFRRQTGRPRRWSPSSATTWRHDCGRRRIRLESAWSTRSNAQRMADRHSGARLSASSVPPTIEKWTGRDSTSTFPSRRLRASILNTSWSRTSGNPRELIPTVATMLSNVDPQLTATDVTTMADVVSGVRAPWRFNMLLFGVFSGLSIGLTVIGIAGLIISTVNWRRREIGVRLALGAQTRNVVSLIAIQGAKLIGVGVGLGVLSSLLVSRLLSSLLFGVAATDPRTLIMVAGGVLAFGVLASYLPARRAATLDPCRIFREE